jgi:Domain of unknown function (DUF4386)
LNAPDPSSSSSSPLPTRRNARIAGVWYLLLAVAGIFAYQYVPHLIIAGDPAATAVNMLGSETLVRVGVVAELAEAVLSIFLVRALYRLLSGVDKNYASLMVTLVLVAVPIAFVLVLAELGALILYSGAGFLSVFGQAQLEALALVLLDLHSEGLYVAAVFWGLWLFPFGILVYKSGFIPRILGVLLAVNGFAYLGISFVSLMLPSYAADVSQVLFLPEALGELSMMVWLLARGIRTVARYDQRPISAPVSFQHSEGAEPATLGES